MMSMKYDEDQIDDDDVDDDDDDDDDQDDKSDGDGVVSYHKSNMLSWSNISIYDFSISMMVMITDDDKDDCR